MSLGEFEKLAFQLISIVHFYVWPFPVKWDYKNLKLVPNKPTLKWIPFAFITLFIWLFGWACLGTTLVFGYFKPRKDFMLVNSAILIVVWAVFSSFTVFTIYCYIYLDAILSAVNELLEITDKITEEYSNRHKWSQEKHIETAVLLPLVAVPLGALGPIFISVAAQYTDFDCPYFVLDELLPDSKYRDRSSIWLLLLCRFVITYVSALEIFRTVLFCSCCVFIVIDRAYKLMIIALARVRSVKGFLKYYLCCSLLFKKVEKVIHVSLYMFMTIGFWMLIVSCWTTVRCNAEDLSYIVYALFVVTLLALIVVHGLVLPMLCSALEIAVVVVKVHTLRAKLLFARWKIRYRKLSLLRVQATEPVRLKYGWFWYLDKKFVGEYFWLIVLRTFDAILLLGN